MESLLNVWFLFVALINITPPKSTTDAFYYSASVVDLGGK